MALGKKRPSKQSTGPVSQLVNQFERATWTNLPNTVEIYVKIIEKDCVIAVNMRNSKRIATLITRLETAGFIPKGGTDKMEMLALPGDYDA